MNLSPRQLVVVSLVVGLLCGQAWPSIPQAGAQAKAHKSSSASKSSNKKKKPVTTAKRRRRSSPRLRRMHQAFVASASLKPMARQLLQDRTPAAYAGVESYARRHAGEDAGALAYLVAGYAHVIDHDYGKAIDPLNRAKPHAGDLGDYVSYYLGSSYFQTGRTAEAIAVLSGFDAAYPDSLLKRDVHVLYANALLSDNRAQAAIDLLEKDRSPTRADVELALGRGYAMVGQTAKAVGILRNLYFTMPLSGEVIQAEIELKKMDTSQLPAPTFSDHKTRAELLLKGRRYSEAADEYRDMQSLADPSVRPAIELALAGALRRSGDAKEAKRLLDGLQSPTPELEAERLFNLGEIARAANDDDEFLRIMAQLRQVGPTSPGLEQALLSAGNIYLLRHDFDHAIDCYRELQQRFPSAGRAAYAHWKAAWFSLRQGRTAEAKQGFEDQIALYPTSPEVPAALYWRARLAEEENEPAKARAYYQKLSDRFHNYYYGDLARQRLAKIKDDGDPVEIALLDRVPPMNSGVAITPGAPPADDLRVQKGRVAGKRSPARFRGARTYGRGQRRSRHQRKLADRRNGANLPGRWPL